VKNRNVLKRKEVKKQPSTIQVTVCFHSYALIKSSAITRLWMKVVLWQRRDVTLNHGWPRKAGQGGCRQLLGGSPPWDGSARPLGVLHCVLGINGTAGARGKSCNLCQTPWLKPLLHQSQPGSCRAREEIPSSQTMCGAFCQRCLGPVSCVHGKTETGL